MVLQLPCHEKSVRPETAEVSDVGMWPLVGKPVTPLVVKEREVDST